MRVFLSGHVILWTLCSASVALWCTPEQQNALHSLQLHKCRGGNKAQI